MRDHCIVELIQEKIDKVIEAASSVLLDKKEAIRLSICCLAARGHLLIEDVPGVGKTTLIRALAKLCGLAHQRVQFTVDLLPGDVVGGSFYNQRSQDFEVRRGPVFTNMLLADELNRASPRSQAALLQAMEEHQVSIDGATFDLPNPFFVIATQNPHQQLGTFPLPESQLDRFLMGLTLTYASPQTEQQLFMEAGADKVNVLPALLTQQDFMHLQAEVATVRLAPLVAQYISGLLSRSRHGFSGLAKGSQPLSTRAGLALAQAARAWALLDKRTFVTPEDVQKVLVAVLGHRLGGRYGVEQGQQWAQELQKETDIPI